MVILERHEREPLNLSKADVRRALKKAKEFRKLVERGITPEMMFQNMIRMFDYEE